ncbi:MAG: hypothetical protein ACRDH0_13570 [Actinomycetota bacterium]
MNHFPERERYEEAAPAGDRLQALAEGLARARADEWLLGSGELVLRDGRGHRLLGRLHTADRRVGGTDIARG